MRVEGQYFGSPASCGSCSRRCSVGSATGGGGVERSYLSAVQLWAGCALDRAAVPPRPRREPSPRGLQGDLRLRVEAHLGRRHPHDGCRDRHAARQRARPGAIVLDAYGGAINRVSPGATAFAHRSMLYSLQYYGGGGDPATLRWVAQFKQAMRPYVNGAAYVNYIDPGQPNWAKAYYGANYAAPAVGQEAVRPVERLPLRPERPPA